MNILSMHTLKQGRFHMTRFWSTYESRRLTTEKLKVVLYCTTGYVMGFRLCYLLSRVLWRSIECLKSRCYVFASLILASLKQTPKYVPWNCFTFQGRNYINSNSIRSRISNTSCIPKLSPLTFGSRMVTISRDPKFRAQSQFLLVF